MSGNAAASGRLWAITSYFNPIRYRRRLANYRVFRSRLRVPLATVELSFDGRFELGAGDAELLVRLRGQDVMWQKERLLNALLCRLPRECSQVAALDCDIVFERDDWQERAAAALSGSALVQLFRRVLHLPPDAGIDGPAAESAVLISHSVAAAVHEGQTLDRALGRATDRDLGVPNPGLALAAPRELLERHGFYDACIVGGGDTALASAAFGAYHHVMRLHCMNEPQRGRYLAWAEPFHGDVRGAIAHLEGDVFHLWHGTMADRRPAQRHEHLGPFDYDPGADIAVAESGCWRWASDKPEMHRYVRDYFVGRREDG